MVILVQEQQRTTKNGKSEASLCDFPVSRKHTNTTSAVELEYRTVDLIDPVVFFLVLFFPTSDTELEDLLSWLGPLSTIGNPFYP